MAKISGILMTIGYSIYLEKMNRAMLFIDAQNLFHGAPSSVNLDYLKLKDLLCGDLNLIRSYFFDSFPTEEQISEAEGDEDLPDLSSKKNFYYFLEMNGFRVVSRPLRRRNGNFIEKGADIRMATELIAQGFNDSYDVAVAVTGDLDFEQSIRYVQDQGKIVKVASFEDSMSGDLKTVSDQYIELDQHIDEISQ